MRAGELNKRITFQQNTPTQNAVGEFIDTYTDYATVWAAIEPLSGRLYFEALQAAMDVSGTIRIRYRSDIVPTMRIKYGNRHFKIITIMQTKEDLEELKILYRELLTDA